MIAIHGIGARTEQQECACPICSFGLALGEALVADEAPCWSPTRPASGTPLSAPYARLPYTPLVETRRARIDYRKPKKRRSTGSHSSVRMLSNNVLAGTHATEQILSKDHQCRARRRVKGGFETDVCDPRLDRAKREVVSLVRLADILPVVDPSGASQLDHVHRWT